MQTSPLSYPVLIFLFYLSFSISLADPPSPVYLSPAELDRRIKEAGQDPIKLLSLVPLANQEAGQRLRRQAHELLLEQVLNRTGVELQQLSEPLVKILPQVARTPEELEELLGSRKKIGRQIVYRRYLEQWFFDHPLPLCVILSARRGEELRVIEARSLLPLP